MATTTRELSLSSVHPNPNQPRQYFDQDALEELAESIRQHGLLQPPVVRKDATGYELIAGERRWRACGLLGLKRLTCRVLEGIADEEAFILSTAENVVRRDMTPMEEAQAYARIAALGRTPEEIAKLFGKGTGEIEIRLSFLNLREDIQHLVSRGHIGKNLASYLSRISLDGQAEVIAKLQNGELANEILAARYATAVLQREQQGDLFGGDLVSPEVAARRAAHRTQIQKAWAAIEGMAARMTDLSQMSDEEIAGALGADCGQFQVRMAALEQQARQLKAAFGRAQTLSMAAAEGERSAAA